MPSAEANKALVREALAALFADFDAAAAARLLADDYVQHNPAVPTGLAPIVGFLPALKESGIGAAAHRVIAEGDYVVVHGAYHRAQLFGGDELVGFDVFRVADGKVAEHWDNLAPLAGANPSGRTQLDGPTEIKDRDKTAENRALVKGFLDSVLVRGRVDEAPKFIDAASYHQHNTGIADGLDGLGAALSAMAAQGITMVYNKVHGLVAEGDFVFAMSEGTLGGEPTAFYDLFRVSGGKIVEHWDVIAGIPDKMAHENGKFGNVAGAARP
ncbi:hypothetical protein DFJ74DRAFT_742834 [Hyaloraphidium curvatum]|nr:hypothetical protein DFJ74DRAFT_742834 [Hyaloraphidium curvatum]